jgi:hypothetical protein
LKSLHSTISYVNFQYFFNRLIFQERGGNKNEGSKIKTDRNGSSFLNVSLNSKNISVRLDINEITVGINTMRNNLLSLFTNAFDPKKFENLKKFNLSTNNRQLNYPDNPTPDPDRLDPDNNNTRIRELIIDLRYIKFLIINNKLR